MITLTVSVNRQQLSLYSGATCLKAYAISTAKNGIGQIKGSEQTPLGWHTIRAKIGDKSPPNTVFVGRRQTGEIYSARLKTLFPERDWILTRIFWLSGLEIGVNRLGNVDTMQRYVYIHGTPDEVLIGQPGSKGCIRMRNQDIIELFNEIPVGTKVLIQP